MNTNYNNPNHTERGQVRPIGGPTYGESPASGPAPTTAGHHRHDILNKLDPRVDSTKDNRPIATDHSHGGNGVPEGTYGPHKSRIANMLDPTVDSDLDSSGRGARAANAVEGGPTTMMHGGGGGGVGYGNSHGNTHGNNNVPEGTYGPHSSRLANALDPRVDSDADRNRHAPGGMGAGYAQQPQGHHGGMTSTGRGGVGNMAAAPGLPGPAPKTAGPHKSDLLNKLDPRVDSKTGAVSGTYSGGVGMQGNTGQQGGRYM